MPTLPAVTLHVPLLRHGPVYRSLDTREVRDAASGRLLAEVSLANPGLIRRDAQRIARHAAALRTVPTARLLGILEAAADRFSDGDVAVPGADTSLSPAAYVELLSASTGLPMAICRRHVGRVHRALAGATEVLAGLTRGLPLPILDAGHGVERGVPLSFYPTA